MQIMRVFSLASQTLPQGAYRFERPAVGSGLVLVLLQQFPKILQQPMKMEVRSRFTLRLMIGYFNTHNNFQKYYMC